MSIVWQILQVVHTVHSEQHYVLMFLSLRFFQFFVLFNDAWSENGHSASNATVILTSSYLWKRGSPEVTRTRHRLVVTVNDFY